jgi:hypothetical protein
MALRNVLPPICLVVCQVTYAQSKTIEITDGQPVAEAVEQLEAIYGLPITYEDTITVNVSQMEDVTEKVQRTPDPSHRIMMIKSRTISFTYKQPSPGGGSLQTKAETEAAVADALSSVLEGYAAAGGLETFTVTNEDGIFHVIAINFMNKEGSIQQMTPILDTKITISPTQRTRLSLFREICQSLTKASGISVEEGDFPFNGGSEQAQTITNISGSDVTARSLLSQLLAEMAAPITKDLVFPGPDGQIVLRNAVLYEGGPLSWMLACDTDLDCMLHIRHVIQEEK